jgi:hypothetical protein
MQDFILAIETAEYTRPNDVFMHTACGGPCSPNSFEPAHPKEGINAREIRVQLIKPVNLWND